MSRSGYIDDGEDNWALIRWRGAVASAIRGRRGQAFLRELLADLDAMENKRLIAGELREGGDVCALGSVGLRRGLKMEDIDPYDYDTVAGTFGVAPALAREIMWLNDEGPYRETHEQRWQRMREEVASLLTDTPQIEDVDA